MPPLDAAAEWLRLTAHYRRMSDGELLSLAANPAALTEAAQQVLRAEFSARRLELPPLEVPASPPEPEPDPDSPYAEDRELVELNKVWSLSDALQLQWLLDRAGIPFYLGDGKVSGVDKLTSNFASGVSVKVMRVGYPWAWEAMKNYEPADEPLPDEEETEDVPEIPVTCPKCRSADVVFERLSPGSSTGEEDPNSNFEWNCDSCGYQWEDKGILKE